MKSKVDRKSVDQARDVLNRALNPEREKMQIKQMKKRKDALVLEVDNESDLSRLEKNEKIQ